MYGTSSRIPRASAILRMSKCPLSAAYSQVLSLSRANLTMSKMAMVFF